MFVLVSLLVLMLLLVLLIVACAGVRVSEAAVDCVRAFDVAGAGPVLVLVLEEAFVFVSVLVLLLLLLLFLVLMFVSVLVLFDCAGIRVRAGLSIIACADGAGVYAGAEVNVLVAAVVVISNCTGDQLNKL